MEKTAYRYEREVNKRVAIQTQLSKKKSKVIINKASQREHSAPRQPS